MGEIDAKEFDARLNSLECSEEIREIVAFLRNAAEQVGRDVVSRAHSTPGSGWGITYKRASRVFCEFDPKPKALHVAVSIRGVDESKLNNAGTVHRRKRGGPWVDIKDMRGAKLLESLIVHAYGEAGARLSRQGANP